MELQACPASQALQVPVAFRRSCEPFAREIDEEDLIPIGRRHANVGHFICRFHSDVPSNRRIRWIAPGGHDDRPAPSTDRASLSIMIRCASIVTIMVTFAGVPTSVKRVEGPRVCAFIASSSHHRPCKYPYILPRYRVGARDFRKPHGQELDGHQPAIVFATIGFLSSTIDR
jgi:hypothetical protein